MLTTDAPRHVCVLLCLQAAVEAHRREKRAAEVAAVVALSVLVLAGGAAAAVCRG